MAAEHIFIPFLIQVVLTLIMYVWLSVVKSRALKRGEVDLEKRALYYEAWPDYVLKVSNNLRNQFESPVLFYGLLLALYTLKAVDLTVIVLAYIFVASRVVHLVIHTGINIVPIRKSIFTIGVLVLIALVVLTALAVIESISPTSSPSL